MRLFVRSLVALAFCAALVLAASSSGPQKVNGQPELSTKTTSVWSPFDSPEPPMPTTTTEAPPPTTEVRQPAPAFTSPPANTSAVSRPVCGADFECFKACTLPIESGGNYATNTGNGHYGAWQFAQGTWDGAVARAGFPEWSGRPASEAPPSVQDAAARQLWLERGTQPWGGRCS